MTAIGRPLPMELSARRGLPRIRKTSGRFEDLLCVLIPASYCLEMELIGRLFVNEIFLLLLLPFLVFKRGGVLKEKLPRTVLTLGVAWLSAQILTDLVRNIELQDSLRGWAKIAFTLTNFSAAYLLLNNIDRRFFLYVVGLAAGSLLQIFLHPNPAFDLESWKFGYAYPLTQFGVLVAVVAGARGRWPIPVTILCALGLANFLFGARGFGTILFLAAALIVLKNLGRDFLLRQTKLAIVSLVAIGFLGAVGIPSGYEYAAGSGLLGPEAQEKYERQSSGSLPLIISGRPQMIAGVMAIADAPILGHGSWAKDKEYAIQLLQTMERLGFEFRIERDDYELGMLIPSHSHLLGAWVEAGVVGAIFWSFALVIAARALFGFLLAGHDRLDPLMAQSVLAIMWSILFSPYGAEERFYTTFLLVFMIWIVQQRSTTTAGAASELSRTGRGPLRHSPRKPIS